MWLKIIPNDTLFFRTGRPFTMGSENWADSVFPPYPSTIYGALRTFLLFERGKLKDFYQGNYTDIGTPDKKGTMIIFGPFFSNSESTFYFPAPFDLIRRKELKIENNLILLNRIKKAKIICSDVKFDEFLIYKNIGNVDVIDGYLDDITLLEYLQNQKKEYFYKPKSQFFTSELKIGIAREKKTLTSKEGYLYRIPMIRLKKDYLFLVKVEGLEGIPDSGVFQFGAEGKTVSFYKISDNYLQNINNIKLKLNDGMFKLYFSTPAIFKKGWIPQWIDENTLGGEFNGIKLKLITCVIGKYLRIGGWDIVKNKPKAMFKAVPAGSVYYFKVLNEASPDKIKELFHFKNISDINPEEGFGLSFVGEVL